MEAECPEAVVKPDRIPDYVAPYGSAFWWNELVYVGATGHIARIRLNEDTGTFHILMRDGSFGQALNPELRLKYEAWVYETFEKHFTSGTDE